VELLNALIALVLVAATWILTVELLGWSAHRHRRQR
jgi:hypothetical protein